MASKAFQLCIAVAAFFLLTSCSAQAGVNGVPEPRPASDNTIANGRQLISKYGCGTCHTIPGVPGANATVGPALDHFYERTVIAGMLPNNEANLIRWIQHPQEVEPGTAMPDMGVTEQDARTIAAYLYHQPSLLDWLSP